MVSFAVLIYAIIANIESIVLSRFHVYLLTYEYNLHIKLLFIRLPKSTTTSSSTAADHRHIVQYGVLTPQVGLVGDLKMSLSDKCGIKSNRLCIAVLSNAKKKNIQIYSDSNPLRTVSLS